MFVLVGCMIMSCSDDNGPSVTVNVTDDDSIYTAGEVVSYTVTATDDLGITLIAVNSTALGLTGSEDISPAEVSVSLTSTISTDATTPAGDYDIEITATDTDGNTDSTTFSITIE